MGQVFLILSDLSDIFPTFWKFLGEKFRQDMTDRAISLRLSIELA